MAVYFHLNFEPCELNSCVLFIRFNRILPENALNISTMVVRTWLLNGRVFLVKPSRNTKIQKYKNIPVFVLLNTKHDSEISFGTPSASWSRVTNQRQRFRYNIISY